MGHHGDTQELGTDWRLLGSWDGATLESGEPQIQYHKQNPAIFKRAMISGNSD